jgi:hypothetical protein
MDEIAITLSGSLQWQIRHLIVHLFPDLYLLYETSMENNSLDATSVLHVCVAPVVYFPSSLIFFTCFPYFEKWKQAYAITMLSVYPPLITFECLNQSI